MKLMFSLIKFYLIQMLRHSFWLLKLSQSKLGKNVKLNFPIIREGKGDFYLGDNGVIDKHTEIGVAENAKLIFGKNSLLEQGATILVRKDCNLTVGNKFKLGRNARLFVTNDWAFGDNINIETNCSIFARESEISGKLIIGDNSNIGDYTIIDLVDDLTIGNDVAIGPNCTIYTHDHIYTDPNKPAWKGGIIAKPIIIKDGAWIGSGVTILPGVLIGERAVVAAGSIVTKDVDSNSIFGGNPAKLIKKIVP